MSQSKKLSPKAYDALHEALCSFWYYKPDFKRRLNFSFSDHPKLLAGLDFEQSKRMISEEVINRLSRDEHVYKDSVIDALLDLSRETATRSSTGFSSVVGK